MKKIVLLIFAAIVIGLIYIWLGGGEPLEFNIEDRDTFYVVGQQFTGAFNSSELEELFFSSKQAALDNNSSLVVVNYSSDTLAESKVSQFIGYKVNQIPKDKDPEEWIKIDKGSFVSTEIKSHNFVMPKPEDVLVEAISYASKEGFRVQNVSIEIYKGERALEVLHPLSRN